MKASFKKAWKIYCLMLVVLTPVFWGYMIYDDWVFIKQTGFLAETFWSLLSWYVAYFLIGFTFYYWMIASLSILIYVKFIRKSA